MVHTYAAGRTINWVCARGLYCVAFPERISILTISASDSVSYPADYRCRVRIGNRVGDGDDSDQLFRMVPPESLYRIGICCDTECYRERMASRWQSDVRMAVATRGQKSGKDGHC